MLDDRAVINADGEDVAMVAVAIVDAQGRVVPVADNEVTFEVSSNACILGVGNGDPSSDEPDKASKREAFNGLLRVIVQGTKQAGPIRLTTRSPGLQSAELMIKAKATQPRPSVP